MGQKIAIWTGKATLVAAGGFMTLLSIAEQITPDPWPLKMMALIAGFVFLALVYNVWRFIFDE